MKLAHSVIHDQRSGVHVLANVDLVNTRLDDKLIALCSPYGQLGQD